jgi:IS4 transposase
MYRNTRFHEVLKGLPRGLFEKAVQQHAADKYSKGFRRWDQYLAMVYAQLSGSCSLRALETGFNSQSIHHYHLGSRPIKRSTLADTNAKRDAGLFKRLCEHLLTQVHRQTRSEFQPMLYLLDSTPIPLKGQAYEAWASAHKTHRTQGLKAHVMLAKATTTPVFLEITPPNVNDIEVGRDIPIERGATYVFDKGYCHYNRWYQIHQSQAYFVTRFKANAGLQVIGEQPIAEPAGHILKDELVRFKNRQPGGHRINHYYGTTLRRIVVARPDKSTPLVLATNDLERPAEAIAALYKQRWDIELFFKWLKQNLRIKKFLGHSENAVRTQIYIAIITYLLVYLMKQREAFKGSLTTFMITLRGHLFQRIETEYQMYRRRQRRHDLLLERQAALPL